MFAISIYLETKTIEKEGGGERVRTQWDYARESCPKSCSKIVVQISFLKLKILKKIVYSSVKKLIKKKVQRNSWSMNRTETDYIKLLARLDQNPTIMRHHKHSAGKSSQDFCHQFLSGEGNHMAFYLQKVLPRWTPWSLLERLLRFHLVSGATHPCNSKTTILITLNWRNLA